MNDLNFGRRHMLGGAALLAATAALPRVAGAMTAAAPDLTKVKTRTTGPVESMIYKAPHYGPNGMWMTDEGLWIIHQIDENYATLIDIETGKVLREIQCEGVVRASGICVDEQGVMWIGSTYNRLIVACDAKTGKAIAKYSTPGAGQIYAVKGDVKGSRSPLAPAYPPPPPSGPSGRRGAGDQGLDATEGPVGTGAHCLLPKGNLLYVDVPPARAIFAIDKTSWQVELMFPTAGDRPHDMAWADAAKTKLWCSDSNYNAFFLHDARTGQLLERVNLPAGSPIIHGAKLHNGYMYMCDDVGWMNRVRF
jgi:streptogramin lyase